MFSIVNTIKKSISRPTDVQDEKTNMDEEICIDILLLTHGQSKTRDNCRIVVPKALPSDNKTWCSSYKSVISCIEAKLKGSLESQNLGLFAANNRIRSADDFTVMCSSHDVNNGSVKFVVVKQDSPFFPFFLLCHVSCFCLILD